MTISPMPSPDQEKFDPNPDPAVWDVERIRAVQAQIRRALLLRDFEEVERLSQLKMDGFRRSAA